MAGPKIRILGHVFQKKQGCTGFLLESSGCLHFWYTNNNVNYYFFRCHTLLYYVKRVVDCLLDAISTQYHREWTVQGNEEE